MYTLTAFEQNREQLTAEFKASTGRYPKSESELKAWTDAICETVIEAYEASGTPSDFKDWLKDAEESEADVEAHLDTRAIH